MNLSRILRSIHARVVAALVLLVIVIVIMVLVEGDTFAPDYMAAVGLHGASAPRE